VSRSKELLAEIVGSVADGLGSMHSILEAELQDPSAAVSDMLDHAARFRGKQLRGAMVLLSGEATGNTTDEHSKVAAIVEMIHLATLVHDDILDGAEVRRRVACVNQRWNNQVAVLLGDYLYSRAFALSTTLSSRLCSSLLAQTTKTICVGEIEQSTLRYDFEMTQDRYEGVCGAKTASLFAAACELGARYPNGDEQAGAVMRSVGWNMGLGFQIIDDYLDVTATEEVVGKTVGCDVEDGKVTLPVLHVYKSASESERERIREIYTQPDLENRMDTLRESVNLEAGLVFARARAMELIENALGSLGTLPESQARTSIESIGEFFLDRNW
jgi:octaprenyl-diphosphate synthase